MACTPLRVPATIVVLESMLEVFKKKREKIWDPSNQVSWGTSAQGLFASVKKKKPIAPYDQDDFFGGLLAEALKLSSARDKDERGDAARLITRHPKLFSSILGKIIDAYNVKNFLLNVYQNALREVSLAMTYQALVQDSFFENPSMALGLYRVSPIWDQTQFAGEISESNSGFGFFEPRSEIKDDWFLVANGAMADKLKSYAIVKASEKDLMDIDARFAFGSSQYMEFKTLLSSRWNRKAIDDDAEFLLSFFPGAKDQTRRVRIKLNDQKLTKRWLPHYKSIKVAKRDPEQGYIDVIIERAAHVLSLDTELAVASFEYEPAQE